MVILDSFILGSSLKESEFLHFSSIKPKVLACPPLHTRSEHLPSPWRLSTGAKLQRKGELKSTTDFTYRRKENDSPESVDVL